MTDQGERPPRTEPMGFTGYNFIDESQGYKVEGVEIKYKSESGWTPSFPVTFDTSTHTGSWTPPDGQPIPNVTQVGTHILIDGPTGWNYTTDLAALNNVQYTSVLGITSGTPEDPTATATVTCGMPEATAPPTA